MILLLISCPGADALSPADSAEVPRWESFDTLDPGRWLTADWTLGKSQLVADNVTIQDGHLVLDHAGAGDTWSGAEVYTADTFTGGQFTARVQPPASPGTVCAFFFYGTDPEGLVHEIDVELLDGRLVVGTFAAWHPSHGYENGPTREYAWIDVATGGVLDYTIDWQPGAVSFAVDGTAVATFTTAVPTLSLPIHLNHWTSDTWPEVGYPPRSPLQCRFDFVDR